LEADERLAKLDDAGDASDGEAAAFAYTADESAPVFLSRGR